MGKLSVYTGIDTGRISVVTGHTVDDSRILRDGMTLHKIRLVEVSAASGQLSGPARGEAVLFDRTGKQYSMGELIRADAAVDRLAAEDRIYFEGTARDSRSLGFISPVLRLRAVIIRDLKFRIEFLGHPASSLFKGLLLGLRDDIPAEMMRGFTATGTVHLFALSGLHVGILYTLVILLLRPLPGRVLPWVGGSLIILFYLFLAGPRPSLIRATLMLMVAALGRLLDRDFRPLNILALVLLAIIMADPRSAFSLSFQLSFLAVAGIIVAGRHLSEVMKPYLPRFVRLPLSCSIGAGVFTLPLILEGFGVYYPIGILTTLLLLPFLTAFMWCGVILLLFLYAQLDFIVETGSVLMHWIYGVMSRLNALLSVVPGIPGEAISLYWMGVGGAAILFLSYRIHSRTTGKGAS
jgi:competence protein ComEC